MIIKLLEKETGDHIEDIEIEDDLYDECLEYVRRNPEQFFEAFLIKAISELIEERVAEEEGEEGEETADDQEE